MRRGAARRGERVNIIVHAEPAHRSFIYDSWMRSYRDSPAVRDIPSPYYERGHSQRMTELLEHSLCLVSRPDDWADGVDGWACGEAHEGVLVLHYVFVKAGLRRGGICASLMKQLSTELGAKTPGIYTHRRAPFTFALERKHGWRYAPAFARGDNR